MHQDEVSFVFGQPIFMNLGFTNCSQPGWPGYDATCRGCTFDVKEAAFARSVGRLWTGVWATLNGIEVPDRLTPGAEAIQRALSFPGNRRGRNPPDHWFTTLRDRPRGGPVRPEIRHRIGVLRGRLRAAV